jgi:hypothetical protein
MSLRIPRRLDETADRLLRHSWSCSSAAAVALGVVLLFWLPSAAAAPVALLVGVYIGSAFGQDTLNRLRGQHDDAQWLIGALRREVAFLKARPVAEAPTKAITYVPDVVVGTKPLTPVADDEAGERP